MRVREGSLRRREFITLIGGATAWPLAARAQQSTKMPAIGVLSPGRSEPPDSSLDLVNAFLQGLQGLGYIEGRIITVERQFAQWQQARLRELAADLVARKVDVLVANSTTAALAAKEATGTIPIVAISMADPVADELVAKRLQLLREVVPGLSRVAALWHPNAYSERTMAGVVKEVEAAAQTLGLALQLVPALSPDDFAGAFAAMTKDRAQALIVLPSPMLFGGYQRIVNMAAENRLPAIGAAREFADFGGLLSYGVNLPQLARQTAPYVDKILKGAKPSELPVEQPTKLELVINVRTARELGLTVSREMLLIADDVIE